MRFQTFSTILCHRFRGFALTKGIRSKRQLLESLYGGQFTLSTPLIKPNFCILLPHRRSTTVSLETTPSSNSLGSISAVLSSVSGLPSSPGEERGLVSRTAAGNRVY